MSLHHLQSFAAINIQGTITKWSPAAEKLTGWPAERALGRPMSDLLVPLEPTEFPDYTTLRRDLDWTGVVAISGVDTSLPMVAQARLVSDSGGEIGLSAALPPSFEAIAAPTQELPLTDDCLNRQRLEVILGHMPGFCYTVDRDLVFTSSDGAGLAGLDLEPNQVVGTSVLSLWNTTEPTYEPLACHLRALAGMAQSYQDACMGRSLEYQLRPLRDQQGRVIGVIGVGFDVTEREQAKEEQAKLSALLRQAQKMEAIGRLAGGVAHDFNNQLTCIMGHLELAARFVELSSKVAVHLEGAKAAVESAASLTRQLLAFSRKQVIVPRALHLGSLLERLSGMLQRVIGESIILNIGYAEDLWQVFADPGQLEQVLMNLVVNARDAIDAEGDIWIDVRNIDVTSPLPAASGLLRVGKYVELSVRDTGRGMSETVLAKLFEPFFTTKEVGAGTGLGLASVYGAIRQNGGNLRVDSRLGDGSTFRIFLPMHDAEPASSTVPEPISASSPIASLIGTETILLVEDEPSVLEVAQCALQQLGYKVLACGGPDEALRVFGEHREDIDMLVTDVVMPRMNGKDLAARLRSLRSGLRVLFTSGFSEPIMAKGGVMEPGLHFLGKPYSPIELATKVRSILNAGRKLPSESTSDQTAAMPSSIAASGTQRAI